MASTDHPADATALRERIRASGLRVTAPRVAVLGYLQALGRPASHADVTGALEASGWDRATLFRNLTDLSEIGLLKRVDLGDHTWRYEAAPPPGGIAHAHFLCTTCGDVACLPPMPAPPTLTTTSAAPRALREGRVDVQIRGICDRCDPTEDAAQR